MIGRLTNKGISEIVKAINGRIRNMLCSHWDHMSYLEDVIKEIKSQIDKVLLPYRKEIDLLEGTTDVNKAAVATFIADLG